MLGEDLSSQEFSNSIQLDFDSYFSSSNESSTWHIASHAIVKLGNNDNRCRIFLGNHSGNGTLILSGGGTLETENTMASIRFGHQKQGAGVLEITEGCTFRSIGEGGWVYTDYNQGASGTIKLQDLNSCFSAQGSYIPIDEQSGTWISKSKHKNHSVTVLHSGDPNKYALDVSSDPDTGLTTIIVCEKN